MEQTMLGVTVFAREQKHTPQYALQLI